MARVKRKVFPSFLGMLLLVGGIAAGVTLVRNPQLLSQKAASTTYSCPSGVSGYVCNDCQGNPFCNTNTTITCSEWRNLNCEGGQCANDPHCYCGGCPSGKWCNNATRTCLNDTGAGNCANNRGDCWVTTPIGIEENPGPDGVRNQCDDRGHWTTCEPGYQCVSLPNGGGDCVPTTSVPPRTPPPPTNRPTPTPVAQCSTVRIFSPRWTSITPTAFKNLKPGNKVYFCVNGIARNTTGSFDKARFTINGDLRPETTFKKPGTNVFCDLYTIPVRTYNFTVQGEIHHTVLGWQ